MNSPLPSDPSRRRSRFPNAWLPIILGSIGGTLSSILALTLLRRGRLPATANRVTVRFRGPGQNIRLRFVVAKPTGRTPLTVRAEVLAPALADVAMPWANPGQSIVSFFPGPPSSTAAF